METPTSFRPVALDQFIGPLRAIAQVRLYQARRLASTRSHNYRLLVSGPPGCGKTTLLRACAAALTGVPSDGTVTLEAAQKLGLLYYSNGQDVTIDVVRDWQRTGHYIPVGIDGHISRRVFWVDECDAISAAALNAWRTFSDTLRPGNDLLLSTNATRAKLQPQFQSRCQFDEVPKVPTKELTAFLQARWNLPSEVASGIAGAVEGDVRAALCEAENWLDSVAAASTAPSALAA